MRRFGARHCRLLLSNKKPDEAALVTFFNGAGREDQSPQNGARSQSIPNITVALEEQVSEGVSGSGIAWLGPGAAVSIPTSGWSGQDCHGAATAAGIAVV